MQIFINGQSRETNETTVFGMLKELNLLPTQVAVEHNGTVLFRHELEDAPLNQGDRIEIIRVVAGG